MPSNSPDQIYVVISEQQTTFLLERILRSAGYTVSLFADVAAATQAMEKFAPDLVIVSNRLSDGSGLELAQSLIDRFPLLPILLFVSQESSEMLRASLHIGIAEILCLPLQSEQILTSIKTCLQRVSQRRDWLALETRRRTDTLQRRVDELEALALLGRSITSSLDLEGVLTAIVDAAVGLTGAEEGSLLLLDEASGELYMRAARNFQEEFVRTFRLPVKDSLAGNVLRTGQPVVLDENTPQKIKTAYLVQGLLYVPLQSHGHVFGVLGVDNRQSRLPFTDTHIKAISAMADYAVIAIENARLYAHTSVERNKLETILTKIQDGVIVISPEDRILMVNQTVREAFHLDEESPTGKLMSEVFEQSDLLDLVSNPEKRVFNRGEIVLGDGRVFSVQLTPIAEVGLVITMHDITYLKKLDRIKSDFVSTVSHDLRSPLTAILGYIDLLDRAGPINTQQREFIQRVQGSVHSITSLVDDLLNLGRIEAGFDSRKEVVPVDHIVQHAIDNFKNRAAEKDLELLLDLPAEVPPLYGNPVQLRQMLDNLIDNAIKYTAQGGTVRTEIQAQRNQIILRVTDTGIGIPGMDLPYIFDKFYRGSNIDEDCTGTGLGLSIVKSIVETHQGRIWVDSTAGQGTTFTVVLPMTEMES